jgi:hypothetical protein
LNIEPLCRAAVQLGDLMLSASTIASIDLNPFIIGTEEEPSSRCSTATNARQERLEETAKQRAATDRVVGQFGASTAPALSSETSALFTAARHRAATARHDSEPDSACGGDT